MHCPHCQATLSDTSQYCTACGRPVTPVAVDQRQLQDQLRQGVQHLAQAMQSLRSGFDAAGKHLEELGQLLTQTLVPLPDQPAPLTTAIPPEPAEPPSPPPASEDSQAVSALEEERLDLAAPAFEESGPADPGTEEAAEDHAEPGHVQASEPEDAVARDFDETPTAEHAPGPEESGPAKPEPVVPDAPAPTDEPIPTRATAPARIQRQRQAQRATFGLEIAMGQKLLLVVGLVLVLIGVGFFLKYSFEQGWIPPVARIAMAYGWGLAMLAAGEYALRKGYHAFGLYIIGGSIAVLYFAAFAGYRIYDLMGPTPTFAVMIGVTMGAIFLALLYDSLGLAVLALVGGFLTPVLLSTGQDNQITLMSYMTVLNGGILTLAFFKRWSLLNYLGLAATHVLYITWFMSYNSPLIYEKTIPALIFLNLFFLIYTVIPFLYDLSAQGKHPAHAAYILIPNLAISFFLTQIMIANFWDEAWDGVACWGYGAVLAVIVMVLHVLRRDRSVLFITSAVLLGLLLLPAMLFVSTGYAATVYWAVTAACFLVLGVRTAKVMPMVWFHVFLVLAMVKFLFNDYAFEFMLKAYDASAYYELMNNTRFALHYDPSYGHLLAQRMLTSLLVILVPLMAALMGRTRSISGKPRTEYDEPVLTMLHGAVFLILTFIILTIECSSLMHDMAPAATMSSLSVLWTVISVLLMLVGFRLRSRALRITAFSLFGVTVVKVFFLDMAQVSTPYRILSFLILGVLLVGTSFLYYKFKDRLLADPPSSSSEPLRRVP